MYWNIFVWQNLINNCVLCPNEHNRRLFIIYFDICSLFLLHMNAPPASRTIDVDSIFTSR